MDYGSRDTSFVALARFFLLVIQHSVVEDNILDEFQLVLGKSSSVECDGGSESVKFMVEELKQMHYLQAALSEPLRLYPSVPIDHKEAENDDVFPDAMYLEKGKQGFVFHLLHGKNGEHMRGGSEEAGPQVAESMAMADEFDSPFEHHSIVKFKHEHVRCRIILCGTSNCGSRTTTSNPCLAKCSPALELY